jgi:hypothetical protein
MKLGLPFLRKHGSFPEVWVRRQILSPKKCTVGKIRMVPVSLFAQN